MLLQPGESVCYPSSVELPKALAHHWPIAQLTFPSTTTPLWPKPLPQTPPPPSKNRYTNSSGDENDPDAPRPLSQGADLSRLLAETEPLYSQAHYRHRALLQTGGDGDGSQPPPVDVAAAEGLLTLDLPALADSLRALPLRELLGG